MEFLIGDIELTSIGVAGQFPDFSDVIPKDADRRSVCGREDLENAVDRASVMASEESKGLRFDFTAGEGMTLSAKSERGESAIYLPSKFEGSPLSIGFNPGFLAEALKASGEDEVTMEFSAPNRPMLLTAREFRYVLMPVNLAA